MTGPGAEGSVTPSGAVVEDRATGALSCPSCDSPVAAGERFCEACGAELGPPAPAPEVATTPRVCRECGGDVADDGYCTRCGAEADSPRDHFSEQPAAWVAAVCDRGIRHSRNEDAVALDAGPEPGSHAVLVVCDGVSSSTDSDVASLAAARAARDVLAVSNPQGMGTAATHIAASARALDRGGGRGQRGRHRPHHGGPGEPGIVHVRRRCRGRAAPHRGLGRRQQGLLAPRRRGAPDC